MPSFLLSCILLENYVYCYVIISNDICNIKVIVTMTIDELRDFCNKNPENFSIQLKRLYPTIHKKIQFEYAGRNFAEKIFKKLNDIEITPTCVRCDREVKFNSFSIGYNKFCSIRCSALDKKINATESRLCINCGNTFSIRKSNDVKTCSETCRRVYLKSDTHKHAVITAQKNTILSKYGVDHISKIPGHGAKVKATKLAKYGDSNWVNSAKGMQTKLRKYGNANYNNQKKAKETLTHKYGVDNYSKTKTFKDAHLSKVLERLPRQYIPMFDSIKYSGVSGSRYKFKCTECNSIFEDYLDNGHQPVCRQCYPMKSVSSIEDELTEYINSLYSGVMVRNTRTIISPRELDIYLPDLKLAIELNGVYFHTEVSGGKDKRYHLQKTDDCVAMGIDLIHITDVEWQTKRDILKGMLKTKLGGELVRIFARNTELRDISYSEYGEFTEDNHLQGTAQASIRYGLYYDGELVSIMSFGKGRYEKNCYELIRYCTRNDVTIVGGFGKLLRKFIHTHPNHRLVSYCDRRYFNGKIYTDNGFTLVNTTVPGYEYVSKTGSIYGRTGFQKHKLPSILSEYDSNLSEWDNMRNNGWDRIWNCGNYKFELFT